MPSAFHSMCVKSFTYTHVFMCLVALLYIANVWCSYVCSSTSTTIFFI